MLVTIKTLRSFNCNVRQLRMCQTTVIQRLLNEVDRLSERLHEDFPTITSEDYQLFGPELKIVIETLKDLRKESRSRQELKLYDERMRQQIADLEELDHDIKVFRVDAPKNQALQQAMNGLAKLESLKDDPDGFFKMGGILGHVDQKTSWEQLREEALSEKFGI